MLNKNHHANAIISLLLTALLGSFVFAFLPVWINLVKTWHHNPDYSHGYLIVPILAYTIWHKRKELVRQPVRTSWLGLVIALASLGLYTLAVFGEVLTAMSLAMLGFIGGAVLFLLGPVVFMRLLMPLSFLVFMIPVPEQIYTNLTVPLQLLVSKVSVAIAQLIDIPILRSGNVIQLPGHTLEIIDACSGIRSLMSLLALSAVGGYFFLRCPSSRLILLLSALPASLLVNALRVLAIVLALHYRGLDLSAGAGHEVLGMAVFLAALGILFLVETVLSKCETLAPSK